MELRETKGRYDNLLTRSPLVNSTVANLEIWSFVQRSEPRQFASILACYVTITLVSSERKNVSAKRQRRFSRKDFLIDVTRPASSHRKFQCDELPSLSATAKKICFLDSLFVKGNLGRYVLFPYQFFLQKKEDFFF